MTAETPVAELSARVAAAGPAGLFDPEAPDQPDAQSGGEIGAFLLERSIPQRLRGD